MWKYIFLLIAYILGSIPFSYLLGKFFKNEDIRKHGSGNTGTTNAFRVFGEIIGILVLILDSLKAGVLVFLITHTGTFDGIDLFHPMIYGFISIIGHMFPVWLKFNGGKGVASSFGLLLAYNYVIALVLLPVFLITLFVTRYVSVSSLMTSAMACVTVIVLYILSPDPLYDIHLIVVTVLATALIFWRHKTNIKRLINREENRITFLDKLEKNTDE